MEAAMDIKGAHILVIDDEEPIRSVVRAMLESANCLVVTAENGEEALAYYAANWLQTDVVVSDMIMPKVSGKDAFHAMKRINPHLRLVLSSGYNISSYAEELMAQGVGAFLQKPFTRAQLLEAVAKALHTDG